MTGPAVTAAPGGRETWAAPDQAEGDQVVATPRTSAICPFLMAGRDPDASVDEPSPAHRCSATDPATPAGLQHQTVFCLGAAHAACHRYRRHAARVTPDARRSRTPLVSFLALGGACVVGAAIAIFFIGNPLSVEPDPATPTQAGATAVASAVAPTTAPAGAGATTPAQATVVATPQPATVVPTPTAGVGTPAPAAVATTGQSTRTYAVQPGDNLTTVARRFGVSVADLAAANGMSPTAILQIGQQLRIPATASPTPTR